jgi:hypothetical protein
MVLDISNIPKNYTGNHRIISITPDTKHFQYIPFALANFITESEENSLLSWCSRQNLNVTSQFIHTNTTDIDHWTDYWEIVFECNASVDFAIQNSSFTDLITEIKTFIDICCCLKITNEEAISVLKSIASSRLVRVQLRNEQYAAAIQKAIAALINQTQHDINALRDKEF